MFDLTGKTALVTGASGGIGGAIAKALHAQGATVALSGTRREALEKVAAELGERTHVLPCDLGDPAATDALVKDAEAAMGKLDILINTAGLTRDLIVTHTRALKLPGVARTFEALARQAREAHWPYEDYLHEVLSAEHISRHESVIRQRLREARFPEVKTLDTFDFGAAGDV